MKTLKQKIKIIPLLGGALVWMKSTSFLSSIYVWISNHFFAKQQNPTYWIDKFVDNAKYQVVQIGSNDGVTGDPINALILKKSKWRVLFVEPVPYLFEKLRNNYSENKRFNFENAAINSGISQSFYSVEKDAIKENPNLPFWYDQLGSFQREHILKHLNGILEPFIREENITGITIDQLFDKYGIKDLEILHIDTEGYDWKILSQLDLRKYRPSIILFEHTHLESHEKRAAISILNHKYATYIFGGDFLCIRRDKIDLSAQLILYKKKVVN